MDGNGRWATNRFLPRVAGHKEGMSRVIDIVRHASNTGVQVLTLYAFSTENWKRPEEEVSGLMKLLIHYVETQLKTLVEERVQVRVIGDMKAFSPAVADAIRRAVEETEQMDGMILNLALNYGGRAEIVRAFHHLKESGQSQITEQMLSDALDTAGQPDPDLLIRTGGEVRLSNFMLYQSAYAELLFVDTLWPMFYPADLDAAIDEYNRRNRRFGDVK